MKKFFNFDCRKNELLESCYDLVAILKGIEFGIISSDHDSPAK